MADGGIRPTGAGTDADTVRIIFAHPGKAEILIPAEVGGGIAGGKAGLLHHIGLVGKFHGGDGHPVFLAQAKNLFRLGGGPGGVGAVQTRAVGQRDQQFGAHSLHKVQHADPLLFGQHIQIPVRHFAVGGAVKVIVGFGGPGARDAYPGRAELPGQLADALVIEVDGGIDLHQVAHHGFQRTAAAHRKGLGSGHLAGGVGFPEGAARDLGKLDVVRHHHGIDFPQSLELGGAHFDEFCHGIAPFYVKFQSAIWQFLPCCFYYTCPDLSRTSAKMPHL